MKLPSINSLIDEAKSTFNRFPVVLLNTFVLVIASLITIENENNRQSQFLLNIIYATAFGVPFLTALTLYIEKKIEHKIALILQLAGLIALIFYAFSLPSHLSDAPHIHFNRLLLLLFAAHMLVAVAPFTIRNQENGFWHFNILLLSRLVTAFLFSTILALGFASALGALDILFNVHISGKRYIDLNVLVYILFNTWYFLSGIPENFEELESSTTNPKIFKILAQYIFSPILISYLIILYAYIIKILLAWSWPRGYVSSIIIGFSIVGFFSLLLLYPLKDRDDNKWIQIIWRWFFIVMIPLAFLLPLAAYQRISHYGFTEERVLLCVITLWLLMMIAYFLFGKKKSIKIIPASLALIALFLSYGPVSIFSISAHNQAAILRDILARDSILVHGNILKEHKQLSHSDTVRISSILCYLDSEHGLNNIQPLVISNSNSPVTLESLYQDINSSHPTSYAHQETSTVTLSSGCVENDVHGYDKFIYSVDVDSANPSLWYDENTVRLTFKDNLQKLTFSFLENKKVVDSLQVDVQEKFQTLISDQAKLKGNPVSPKKMVVAAEKGKLKIKIFFRKIVLIKTQDKAIPKSLYFDLYYATGRYEK